uniref:magnetosome-associated protein MamJ-like n=1 Tax=Doryrhamphus excisus TaxID=161450 RepID=UPI0025AE6B23|nr:magnetosome-associated protein MamJ-like [Doryrhamphus excisus]
MGNKFIRKRESPVGSVGPVQKPAEDQKTTQMGASDVTPAQETMPAEKLDVVVGKEVAEEPCLSDEKCVSKLEATPEPYSEPNPEACVVDPAPVTEGKNDLSSVSSSPSIELNTPDGTPNPYQTPTEVLVNNGSQDDAAATLEPEKPEEEPEPAVDPVEVVGAGDMKQREESIGESLKKLSLNAGAELDLIDDTPIDTSSNTIPVM